MPSDARHPTRTILCVEISHLRKEVRVFDILRPLYFFLAKCSGIGMHNSAKAVSFCKFFERKGTVVFTEARKTEIKSQLLVAANTLTSSRAARLEVDLAPNEKPSERPG